MQVILIMFRADGERRSFSIVRDMTVVGRREDCDLRIPLGEVSRKHCRLIKDGDSVRLEDLGSSNGTHHNGQRVQEAVLSPGDTIKVGPVTFVVQIDGVPSDEELHPATSAAGTPASEEIADFEPSSDDSADGDAPSEQIPGAPTITDTRSAGKNKPAVDEIPVPLHTAEPVAEEDELLDFNFEEPEQSPSPHDRPS